MQTAFTAEQLADPHTRESEKILRSCVHCGFCTATCPTYLLLGDELDSPRGRIYLIKDMLEGGKPATAEVVKHVDRCLSCLSCMTTCPSGVHYMHLVDHARAHIQSTYRRPLADRLLRTLLARVLPYRGSFKLALRAAALGRPFKGIVARLPGVGAKLGAMLDLAPASIPKGPARGPGTIAATGLHVRKRRMALLTGCAQPVLQPQINEAAIRLLTRLGVDVVLPRGEGCCGALVHHMGREADALGFARRNIDAWLGEIETGGLDAIVMTASGCGTTVKDYGFMLREDPNYAEKARRVSAMTKDIVEVLTEMNADLVKAPPGEFMISRAPIGQAPIGQAPNGQATSTGQTHAGLVVAYHSACSMQHGQAIRDQPKRLLQAAGFRVKDVPEGHICCGSAGTYNILQPEIAGRLRDRKVKNIERTKPQVIATGNIGCITQIALGTQIPIVHTVELLDWAAGGLKPAVLAGLV